MGSYGLDGKNRMLFSWIGCIVEPGLSVSGET